MIKIVRRADLLDPPGVHHHDAVGERHRLDLIVGDVDRRRAEPAWSRARSARISTRSLASRLESGSSNRKTFGLARWRGRWRRAGAGRRKARRGGRSKRIGRWICRVSATRVFLAASAAGTAMAAERRCSRRPSCAGRARSSGNHRRRRGRRRMPLTLPPADRDGAAPIDSSPRSCAASSTCRSRRGRPAPRIPCRNVKADAAQSPQLSSYRFTTLRNATSAMDQPLVAPAVSPAM